MAILRIPDENRSLQEHDEVRDFLAGIGIDYEYWDPVTGVLPVWRQQKREICIYSPGSVLAQQLLFRSVAYGDLTPHIAAFFDMWVGSKTQSEATEKLSNRWRVILAMFYLSPTP